MRIQAQTPKPKIYCSQIVWRRLSASAAGPGIAKVGRPSHDNRGSKRGWPMQLSARQGSDSAGNANPIDHTPLRLAAFASQQAPLQSEPISHRRPSAKPACKLPRNGPRCLASAVAPTLRPRLRLEWLKRSWPLLERRKTSWTLQLPRLPIPRSPCHRHLPNQLPLPGQSHRLRRPGQSRRRRHWISNPQPEAALRLVLAAECVLRSRPLQVPGSSC